MEAESKIFEFMGLSFSVPVVASTVVTCLLILLFCMIATRNVAIRPTKLQNVFEYVMDFAKGIIEGALDWSVGKAYHLLIFTLFMFIFVANTVGLIFYIHIGEYSYFSSPTASPIVCLMLSLMIALIVQISGVRRMGFKQYVHSSFLSPNKAMMPLKVIEEFTNVITLALRLYGNIFAGEVLLSLIVLFASSMQPISWVLAMPLSLLWQGFSLAIGILQAFIFCTLSMVYISHKVDHED